MATFISDILLDDTYDIAVDGDDWAIGLSDNQNVEQIIDSNRGEWLFHPETGVGITRFLNGNISYAQVETLIVQQLEQDGYDQVEFNVNEDDLETQLILSDDLILNINAYRP